jgi:hypothetical protein
LLVGFEFRALWLLGMNFSFEPYSWPFLTLVIFQIGSLTFCSGRPQTTILLPLCLPYTQLELQAKCYQAELVCWDGGRVLLVFCTDWPWTIILLISNSQVAGIIGMSPHAWPKKKSFIIFTSYQSDPFKPVVPSYTDLLY